MAEREKYTPTGEKGGKTDEIEKYFKKAFGSSIYENFTPTTKELLYEIAGTEGRDKFRAERTAKFFLEIDRCIDYFTHSKSYRKYLLPDKSQTIGEELNSSATLSKELIEKQFIELIDEKEKAKRIYNQSLRDKIGNSYERFTPMVKELLEEMRGEEWRGEKWQHQYSWERAENNEKRVEWEKWEKEDRPYQIARFAEELFNSIDHYTLEKCTLGDELLSDEERELAKNEELTTEKMAEVSAVFAKKFIENQYLKGYSKTWDSKWHKKD